MAKPVFASGIHSCGVLWHVCKTKQKLLDLSDYQSIMMDLTWRNIDASRGSFHKTRGDLRIRVLLRVARVQIVDLLTCQRAGQ